MSNFLNIRKNITTQGVIDAGGKSILAANLPPVSTAAKGRER
jgi:hypothetical protein